MKSSVFWALVRKDLYLMRGFMIATVLTGVVAVVLMGFGKVGFAVGGILFITADVASGIFIAMYSLMTERKDLSRMFALSLPISGYRYDLSKLLSGYLAYGIPWFVMTAIALGVFLLPGAERGMLVYALLIQAFVLALFSVILAALFVVSSEAMSGLAILVVNICFSLFMVELNQPQISAPLHSSAIVWTPFAVKALSGDALLLALSIAYALFLTSRRRDYI
jgi:ABC-2 type transport system permease protein